MTCAVLCGAMCAMAGRQVGGCTAELSGTKGYYQRYRICPHHLQLLSQIVDGRVCRFCQQCGGSQRQGTGCMPACPLACLLACLPWEWRQGVVGVRALGPWGTACTLEQGQGLPPQARGYPHRVLDLAGFAAGWLRLGRHCGWLGLRVQGGQPDHSVPALPRCTMLCRAVLFCSVPCCAQASSMISTSLTATAAAAAGS